MLHSVAKLLRQGGCQAGSAPKMAEAAGVSGLVSGLGLVHLRSMTYFRDAGCASFSFALCQVKRFHIKRWHFVAVHMLAKLLQRYNILLC